MASCGGNTIQSIYDVSAADIMHSFSLQNAGDKMRYFEDGGAMEGSVLNMEVFSPWGSSPVGTVL